MPLYTRARYWSENPHIHTRAYNSGNYSYVSATNPPNSPVQIPPLIEVPRPPLCPPLSVGSGCDVHPKRLQSSFSYTPSGSPDDCYPIWYTICVPDTGTAACPTALSMVPGIGTVQLNIEPVESEAVPTSGPSGSDCRNRDLAFGPAPIATL